MAQERNKDLAVAESKEIKAGLIKSCFYNPSLTEKLRPLLELDRVFKLLYQGYCEGCLDHESMISFMEGKKVSFYSIGYNVDYTFDPELFEDRVNIYLQSLNRIKVRDILQETIKGFDDYKLSEILVRLKNIEIDKKQKRDDNLSENIERLIQEVVDEYNAEKPAVFNLPSLPTFNKVTGGIRKQNMIVLAGAYKQGKTTIGLQMLLDLAVKEKIKVGLFNMEMSEREIFSKVMSMKTGIPYEKLRNPKLFTKDELQDLGVKALRQFYNTHIFVRNEVMNELEIENTIIGWVEEGVEFIMIDYIGRIQLSGKFNNREQEVSYLSGKVKTWATKFNIPILLLAQLNRGGVKSAESVNMAESIAIARDADYVFTVSKPDLGEKFKVFDKGEYTGEEGMFILTLTDSRHTASGRVILTKIIGEKIIELA